jgi:hypothetical protein
MKTWLLAGGVLLLAATSLIAQQQPARRDTTRADSARAKAIADSLELVRQAEAAQGAQQPPQQQPMGAASGPTNPRLLPDFSAVGDLVGDLSPKGSTQDDNTRFGVREVELAVQAAVDPYFRGDVFLGLNDLEKVSIEQAFLTTTALPYGLELRLGRELLPIGKQNETHRHDLQTIEYPWVLQRFLSPDGLKGTGIRISKLLAPFGFYQELIVTVDDQFGEGSDTLQTLLAVNRRLGGMGFTARFRNYWDLTQNANLELSASAATGDRAQPVTGELLPTGINAIIARQSLVGADLTFRWRPLQQGLYRSFILQVEVMGQFNEHNPTIPPELEQFTYAGPTRDFAGAYVFARWQIRQRAFIGARGDWLQDPLLNGGNFLAGSLYYELFPSEFSKINLAYERTAPHEQVAVNRFLLQASFSLGPHKPHPF